MCFNTERSKEKKLRNENVLQSEDSFMHYKGRPSNYMFHLLLKLEGRREENSCYFSNVQPCTITCTLDAFIGYAGISM